MKKEAGGSQLFHIRNNMISFGIYRGMPSYAKSVLELQLRHANFPSGWVYVGRRAASGAIGINDKSWLKALYFLAVNGFYEEWGHMKTTGKPAIAVKLKLPVPRVKADIPENPPRKPWHCRSAKVEPLTIALLEAHLSTIIGQPWHSDKIKSDTIAFNSFEPREKVGDKSPPEKQEPTALIKKNITVLSKMATPGNLKRALEEIPCEEHWQIMAYLRGRYKHDLPGLSKLEQTKDDYDAKHRH